MLQDAALAFCEEHNLDLGIAPPLALHIQGNLDQAQDELVVQVPHSRLFGSCVPITKYISSAHFTDSSGAP